jgi:hypothetical protein
MKELLKPSRICFIEAFWLPTPSSIVNHNVEEENEVKCLNFVCASMNCEKWKMLEWKTSNIFLSN